MTIWAWDIETDAFLRECTKVHLGVFLNVDTNEFVLTYSAAETYRFIRSRYAEGDIFVGHNVFNFDIPVLAKLTDTVSNWIHLLSGRQAFYDTLLLHKLLCPSWEHSRSLGELGQRLFNKPKIEYSDFSKFTNEMVEYAKRDVEITAMLFNHLRNEYRGSLQKMSKALRLENDFALIIGLSQLNGFPVDWSAIQEFRQGLQERLDIVDKELREQFKGWFVSEGEFIPKVNRKPDGITKGEAYSKIKYIEFNPGSHAHLARVLQEMGWQPKKFTESGKPVTGREIIEALDTEQFPQAKLLVERSFLQKRISETDYEKNLICDGRAVGWEIDTLGAITRRCTHSNINIANVVKSGAPFSDGVRANFKAPEGYRVLGVDLTGIEFRMLAEYLAPFDRGRAIEVALRPGVDIHFENASILGLDDPQKSGRTIAKTFLYAMMYAASAVKLGKKVVSPELLSQALRTKGTKPWFDTLKYLRHLEDLKPDQFTGVPRKGPEWDRFVATAYLGRYFKQLFYDKFPGLKAFVDHTQAEYKKGALYSVDGYRIWAAQDYSAVNSLLQMAGSLAAKAMTVLCVKNALKEGIALGRDYFLAAHVHDEEQFIVKEDKVEDLKRIALASVTEAGKYLGFKIRLDGEAKIGYSWADTH